MTVRRKRFAADRGGNFAILSALLAIPLVLSAGVALDVATISRTKTELQQALDAAVLAVAREGKEIDDKQAVQIAADFIATNYELKFTDLKVVHEGTGVKLDARTAAPIAFGALFGYDDWKVDASSSADIAYVSYEIALVLDTTGSMAGGKLSSMKEAVDGMIESMSAQMKNKDKLKFALVPFATFVNVGPEFGPQFNAKGKIVKGTGAGWLDLNGKSDIPQLELKKGISRFETMHNLGQDWKGCVETRYPSKGGAHDVADTAPVKKDARSLFVPTFAIDEPDTGEYANSYIQSPVDPLDKSLVAEVAKLAKYGITGLLQTVGAEDVVAVLNPVDADISEHRGPGQGCDMQPLTPLTNEYNMVRGKVSTLVASGTTNIMEGVAWGMRVLSPGEPFTQGAKLGSDVEKIMVVLTDGANNLGPTGTKLGSSYSSFGYLVDGRLGTVDGASTNGEMNKKTLLACSNAKEQDITVYTIRLEEPDVKTGTMLQECASSPEHYFDAPSRSQLDEVFETIKDRIVKLRLSS